MFFKADAPFLIFLLNIVLKSKEMCKNYCYCKNIIGKCLACQFKTFYMNSKYGLYENCFDRHFLHFFHLCICDNLKKLIILDSHLRKKKTKNIPYMFIARKFKKIFYYNDSILMKKFCGVKNCSRK